MDWGKQLQSNERRTYLVMGTFILIYVAIGLLVDLFIHPELDHLLLATRLELLLTFQVFPGATLVLAGVAVLSLLITYALHDRIMLLGTEHREITAESADSLAERQLYNVLEELKIASSLRYMPKVYVIDAEYMNAFASGYSEKSALVAITRGLLNKLDRSELQAVIAHELNHIRHHDIKLTLTAVVLSNIMLIVLDIMFRGILFGGRSGRGRGNRGGNGLIMVIFLLRFVLPLVTILLLLYLSRRREFMADAGAVELMRDNTPLAKALIKISQDHAAHKEQYAELYRNAAHEELRKEMYIFDPYQSAVTNQHTVTSMFSTHPSLEERLEALGWQGK